jgi:hypothetical protein
LEAVVVSPEDNTHPTGRKEVMMNVWIKLVLRQLLGEATDKPNQQGLSFTKKCMQQMKDWQLSEKDAADVFQHGQICSENTMVRKYNGYEIGMYYFRDAKSGNYIATAVWKRERR